MQLAIWHYRVVPSSMTVFSGPPQCYQFHTQPAPSNLKPKKAPRRETYQVE